jgi:outer membrane protein TolC
MKKRNISNNPQQFTLNHLLTIFTLAIGICFPFVGIKAQKTLDYETYYKLVLTNHPIVKQANLLDDISKLEIRTARGMFDPKFDFDLSSKTYNGKKYFEYMDYGLKIPTWFGGDLKFGYENNSGLNANPFDYTPKGGLIFAGIEMPLNSVLFDERRAMVRQAQNLQRINTAEQIKTINKTLLSASKSYWEWFFSYHKFKTREESYKVAMETYRAVRGRIEGGDFASIDSVEALMNLQERNIDLIDALNEYQKAGFDVALNLWTENSEPLELENGTIPEALNENYNPTDTVLINYVENAKTYQPEILKMNYKLTKLQIDQRMYMQGMIPNVNFLLKYLTSPSTFGTEDLNFPYAQNNYKLGIHVVQSLFLRKERAKFKMTKVKIEQTLFEQKVVVREIENSVRMCHNDLINYMSLYQLQKSMFVSSEKMFEAEKVKFQMGEATLFYLNIRQSKMLESKIKTYSYYAKLRKSEAILNWTAGIRR